MIKDFEQLKEMLRSMPVKRRVAVTPAQDEHTLEAISHAYKDGMVEPVLITEGSLKYSASIRLINAQTVWVSTRPIIRYNTGILVIIADAAYIFIQQYLTGGFRRSFHTGREKLQSLISKGHCMAFIHKPDSSCHGIT